VQSLDNQKKVCLANGRVAWRAVKHARVIMTCEVNASRIASFGIDKIADRDVLKHKV
jgi:hypothetical protein